MIREATKEMNFDFKFKGKVEIFPGKAAWTYIRIPKKIQEVVAGVEFKGMIPIVAKIGETSWKTSLLPIGDGDHFIALKASVRKAEKIKLREIVEIKFSVN